MAANWGIFSIFSGLSGRKTAPKPLKTSAQKGASDDSGFFIPLNWGWSGFSSAKTVMPSEAISFAYAVNLYVGLAASLKARRIARLYVQPENQRGTGATQAILDNPSKIDQRNDFYEKLLLYYYVTGEGFVFLDTLDGSETLFVADPRDVTIQFKSGLIGGRATSYNWINPAIGIGKDFPPEKVWHFKIANICTKDGRGWSPINGLRDVVSASNEMWVAANSLHKNMGASGVISPADQYGSLTPKDRKRFQNALNKNLGGASNYGNIYYATKPVKYDRLTATAKDLELSVNNTMLLRAIAAKMQVPSAMMGDAELKYANMAEMQTSFAVNVLIPDANEFYQQFCDFLTRSLGAPKIKVFIDKKQFPELSSEQKAAQDAIRADVQAGIITADQARLILYPQLTPTPLDKFLS